MRQLYNSIDKPLLWSSLALFIFGLLMIISSSSTVTLLRYKSDNIFKYGVQQAAFIMVGIVFSYIFILRRPIRKTLKWGSVLMILVTLALIYVKMKGTVTNNAQSWLTVLGVRLQPSELAKPIIILYMAFLFTKLNRFKANYRQFFYAISPIIISIIAVAVQPDFGTAAIMAGIVIGIILIIPQASNIKSKILLASGIGILSFFLVFVFLGNNIFTPEQIKRIETFSNPCADYYNEGLQVCNSLIAINESNGLGKGINNSTQKHLYLPESYTDFIMAITVEETGLIGFSGVMFAYLIILTRLFIIARRSTNISGAVIAYGVAIYIFIHIFINLGGISAIIPLTGVPLPFMTYGGSYAISLIIALAMALRVSHDNQLKSY